MKTFKEYREKAKTKPESMETVFGSHSIPKSARNAMETEFGKHSQPKDSDPKEPVVESVILSDDVVAKHGNTTEQEERIHKTAAPYNKKKVSEDEHEAITDYTDESRPINSMLHQHDKGHDISGPNKKSYRKTTDHLDAVLSRQSTKEDMHVFTGLKHSPTKHFKKVDGKVPDKVEVSLPAFTSTSTCMRTARGFSQIINHPNDERHGIQYPPTEHGARHILKIHVPKGSKAMSVKAASFAPSEREVLMHRGHHIEIHGTPDHIHKDTYLWYGTLVAHKPHDLNKEVE